MRANTVGMSEGLGNQLFQYAFGVWLEAQTGMPTRFDTSSYRTRPGYFLINRMLSSPIRHRHGLSWVPYPRGRFPRLADSIRRALRPVTISFEDPESSMPAPFGRPAWYYGWWQMPAMVDEVIDRVRSDLAVSSITAEGIGVHVRRGDMVAHGGALPPEFYSTALAALRAAHHLPASMPVTVFSDDPEWCRAHLQFDFQPAAAGRADEHLRSLAACRYLVLSASTFSWWAAMLAPRDPRTVAAPAPFILNHYRELGRDGWIRVPRD